MQVFEIKNVVKESRDVKTFVFDGNLNARPGQFVMAWLPRINEKPFAISFQSKDKFAITVMKRGDFTNELFKMKIGGKVGIRGPFGNSFSFNEKMILVGGGYGVAPLAFLAEEGVKIGSEIEFLIGGKSKENLLFLSRLEKIKLFPVTEDGCFGASGLVTDWLEDLISKDKKVCACGPEPMLKKILEICKNKCEVEVSLESRIRCGLGICGDCCIKDFRVCKDGPVVSGDEARRLICS